jgi:hypothetical protein
MNWRKYTSRDFELLLSEHLAKESRFFWIVLVTLATL